MNCLKGIVRLDEDMATGARSSVNTAIKTIVLIFIFITPIYYFVRQAVKY